MGGKDAVYKCEVVAMGGRRSLEQTSNLAIVEFLARVCEVVGNLD